MSNLTQEQMSSVRLQASKLTVGETLYNVIGKKYTFVGVNKVTEPNQLIFMDHTGQLTQRDLYGRYLLKTDSQNDSHIHNMDIIKLQDLTELYINLYANGKVSSHFTKEQAEHAAKDEGSGCLVVAKKFIYSNGNLEYDWTGIV